MRNSSRVLSVAVSIAALVSLSACARLTHLTRSVDLPKGAGDGKAVLIDAKQRAIVSAHAKAVSTTGATSTETTYFRLCAEPSPDALSALAASSGLSLSKSDTLGLANNFAVAEAAGSIGLRTQSIQLLRDAMYRVCEGYLSGALKGPDFITMMRRYQSSMVAVLAIEQLTGTVRAPTVVLTARGAAGDAERATDLTTRAELALQSLRASEVSLAEKNSARDKVAAELERQKADAKALDDKKAAGATLTADETSRRAKLEQDMKASSSALETAQKEAADALKIKNDREANHKNLDAARQAALAGGGSASTSGQIGNPFAAEVSAEKIASVATAVKEIVASTLELQFGPELCATVLLDAASPTGAGSIHAHCVRYLEESVNALKIWSDNTKQAGPSVSKLIDAYADALAKGRPVSSETANAVQKIIESQKPPPVRYLLEAQ